MRKDLLHYYRDARRHQLATYGNSGLWIDGRDARQFTGGGAAYGEHALAAYWAARRRIYFMAQLRAATRQRRAAT
ncbi:MAG: hypothetical protein VW338_15980 [Rhodospirillaceae bacterium]